jgi:hypothetical protein
MSSSGVAASGITVAAPPSTAAAASQILATMAALSGVLTDYNPGSQARTMSEATGSVVEEQGIWAQAQAVQALVYSALSLFNISQGSSTYSVGTVTFSTSNGGSPPPSSINVPIPVGTIVQTNGGVQFATTTAATLVAGASSINVSVQAVQPGLASNVPIGAIVQIVSGLTAPLFVNNAAPTAGGANIPPLSDALAQFSAEISSIGLSTPVAIANAAIGVAFNAETVQYSTVFEPWIAAGSGAGSGTAGWNLIIDNGTGTASSGLINNVNLKLLGGTVSGASNASGAFGYRDAGVPYNIYAVTGTYALVSISGTLFNYNNSGTVSGAIAAAVSGYFTLPFGANAERSFIDAAVANSVAGQLSSLSVQLAQSGIGTPVDLITVSPSGRILLRSLSISLASGT